MPKSHYTRKKRTTADGDERPSTHDIWKGSITFGLVEIPVALVSAETPNDIKLSYLDRRNFSPIGYRRYNKANQKEVPWSEIVHGYEYEKGQFVALGKEELKKANPSLTQTISIEQFVDAAAIEPIYFDRPYYLEPLKPGSKSYALLRQTLEKTGKVGIARVAVRTREHVAVVGVRDKALVLYLLRYADEVRAPDALDNLRGHASEVRVSAQELKMAERLVEDMSGPFDLAAYHDDHQADLLKLIRAKVKSGETHALSKPEKEKEPKRTGEIFDLMPLLKRSVEEAHAGSRTKRPRTAASRTPKLRAVKKSRAGLTRSA